MEKNRRLTRNLEQAQSLNKIQNHTICLKTAQNAKLRNSLSEYKSSLGIIKVGKYSIKPTKVTEVNGLHILENSAYQFLGFSGQDETLEISFSFTCRGVEGE